MTADRPEYVPIDELLTACVEQDASDLHIRVGQPPVMRIGGRLHGIKTKALGSNDMHWLLQFITPIACRKELLSTGSAEFSFGFGDTARFRVLVSRAEGKTALVFHRMRPEVAVG